MSLFVFKTIFFILDFILIGLIVFAAVKAWPYRPDIRLFPKKPKRALTLKTEAFRDHWRSILEKSASGDPESMKVAIIEADALVDDLLKQLGYEGDHLADRLARVRSEDFPSTEKLWRAHRLRNELVHTPGFQISREHAGDMIGIYERFLKEVGILQ